MEKQSHLTLLQYINSTIHGYLFWCGQVLNPLVAKTQEVVETTNSPLVYVLGRLHCQQERLSNRITSGHLGIFHQHVLPWDSNILHFKVAIVNFIKPKLGADISNNNT